MPLRRLYQKNNLGGGERNWSSDRNKAPIDRRELSDISVGLWKEVEDGKIGKRSRCDATSYQLSMAITRELGSAGLPVVTPLAWKSQKSRMPNSKALERTIVRSVGAASGFI